MTCPFCDGQGTVTKPGCNGNADCEGGCEGCPERADTEYCYACEGECEITDQYFKELKYED